MQEQNEVRPTSAAPTGTLPGQSLAALLALVGREEMDIEALKARTKLTPMTFATLPSWMQEEHLVDVASSPKGNWRNKKVGLTGRGEEFLVRLLERTCELPELR